MTCAEQWSGKIRHALVPSGVAGLWVELRALSLRPGTSEPAAILEDAFKDRSGICALYARDEAVPMTAPREPA